MVTIRVSQPTANSRPVVANTGFNIFDYIRYGIPLSLRQKKIEENAFKRRRTK